MALSNLIFSFAVKILKNLFKIDDRVEEISKRFQQTCPPKSDLLSIIKTKNNLTSGLNGVTKLLTALQGLSKTVNTTLTATQVATLAAKFAPIPMPPGTPVSVPNIFADTLDTLKDIITTSKGNVKQ